MRKERLTLSHVAEDLKVSAAVLADGAENRHIYWATRLICVALGAGLVTGRVWVGLIIALFALLPIVLYVKVYRTYRRNRAALSAAIERGDISISVKKFSHIAEELVYEPHVHVRHVHHTRLATFFYFTSGSRWRQPSVDRHYPWSNEYAFTSKGLQNVSIGGDEFYFVSLQGYPDVTYIYPCKYFELDSALCKGVTK